MTLADLLPRLPLPAEEAFGYGLLFSQELADRLAQVQAEHPTQFLAEPRVCVDGRNFLHGSLLTEVPNGLYGAGFSYLDASRFDQIEVVPLADATALLPPAPPEL